MLCLFPSIFKLSFRNSLTSCLILFSLNLFTLLIIILFLRLSISSSIFLFFHSKISNLFSFLLFHSLFLILPSFFFIVIINIIYTYIFIYSFSSYIINDTFIVCIYNCIKPTINFNFILDGIIPKIGLYHILMHKSL